MRAWLHIHGHTHARLYMHGHTHPRLHIHGYTSTAAGATGRQLTLFQLLVRARHFLPAVQADYEKVRGVPLLRGVRFGADS